MQCHWPALRLELPTSHRCGLQSFFHLEHCSTLISNMIQFFISISDEPGPNLNYRKISICSKIFKKTAMQAHKAVIASCLSLCSVMSRIPTFRLLAFNYKKNCVCQITEPPLLGRLPHIVLSQLLRALEIAVRDSKFFGGMFNLRYNLFSPLFMPCASQRLQCSWPRRRQADYTPEATTTPSSIVKITLTFKLRYFVHRG